MIYKKGKTLIYLILIIIIVVILIFMFIKNQKDVVDINGNKIRVEIVSTVVDQYAGLSNRDYLCWDCGMLFSFPQKAVREFVMRDMNFPLNIIFISDNKIVKISEKLRLGGTSPLEVYSSEQPIDYALEVNAGYCGDKKIKVGDSISIKQ